MTKEEAQKKLLEEKIGWCPIGKCNCRSDCACYMKGSIIGDSNNKYHVLTPYCKHGLLNIRQRMI